MNYGRIQKEIEIPENITVKLQGFKLKLKGKMGEIEKDFEHTRIKIQEVDNKIVLSSYFPRKKEKALLGTVNAHIKNMIEGVSYGYKYNMKIVFSHFPIRVTPEKTRVKIENLYGGRKPKYATIMPGAKVVVDNEDVVITGIEKDAVGQTAANIQELTRLRGSKRQSPKTFMDGIYVYEKGNIENPV